MGKNKRLKESRDTCRGKQTDTFMCCVDFFFCAYTHEPSSHSTEVRGGRGSFHSVHCLVIVLLQGFTSFSFLRTFEEVYTGQDTFFFVLFIHDFGCRVKLNQRGLIVEGGIYSR